MRIVNTREYQTAPADLDLIHKVSGNADLAESDVFLFPPFCICHSGPNKNHTDITADGQKKAADAWIGKAILYRDHESKTENQIGRIYKSWTEDRDGLTYTYGRAYGVRTDDLQDIYKRIESGIHREMSCGYEPVKSLCSLCQSDLAPPAFARCPQGHEIGSGGCYALDVEFRPDHVSFVAAPAVEGAGLVTQGEAERVLRTHGVDLDQLRRDAQDGQLVRSWATAEFAKWYRLNNRAAKPEHVESLCSRLTAAEMITLAKLEQAEFGKLVPDLTQQTRTAAVSEKAESNELSPANQWRDDSDVISSSKKTRVF